MTKIIIKNSGMLSGNVEVSGSKNAVLPLLAATLLTDDICTIRDVPALKDVEAMCKILESLGTEITAKPEEFSIDLLTGKIKTSVAPCGLVQQMRASIIVMGPLLARTGKARIPLPGGCAIGDRPIDLHIKGFVALGADVETKRDDMGVGYVEARAQRLKGAEIYLDTPSVGATENIMMAAVMAEGLTLIENAAQEPEIVDLANFLNKMGAKIKGSGTNVIKIEGVTELHGANHSVIPDRIEACTFMLAAAITRGDIIITNVLPNHILPVIAKLRECGVLIEDTDSGLRVKADENELIATELKTNPYPGFPTDVQPQFMAFLATTSGSATVLETVFENRFMHINELNKMNAKIIEEGRRAIIPGGASLHGAEVRATDLRAGAALVLAGLAASGETTVLDVYHIDRGYDGIVDKLRGLGADIVRKSD